MKRTYCCILFLILAVMLIAGLAIIPPAYGGDVKVMLQIPIPGLEQGLRVCKTIGKNLNCSGIADYIASLYRWLIGVAAVLAVIALTWSGIQWLSSGGDSGKIQEAKKVMGNAMIGLLLVLGSYTLLATINPKLVAYDALQVPSIEPISIKLADAMLAHEEVRGKGKFSLSSGVSVSGFSNITFDGKAEVHDIETPGVITQLLADLLKEIDTQGFKVKVSAMNTGHSTGKTLHNPAGRAVDLVGDQDTLRRLASYLDANHTRLQVNELYYAHNTGAAVEDCIPQTSAYLDARPNLKEVHRDHLHVAVGCGKRAFPKTSVETSAAAVASRPEEEDRPSPESTSVAQDPSLCVTASVASPQPSRKISSVGERRAATACDASQSIQLELKSTSYAIQNYTKLGFPPSQKIRKIVRDDAKKQWLEVAQAIEQASLSAGVDPGIVGMWAWHESDFNYFQDNCGDSDYKVNTPCNAWDGSRWQVGLGVHTEQRVYLKEAFEKMYGSDSPQKIQEVGQSVIDRSQEGAAIGKPARVYKIITTFPSLPLDHILAKAEQGTAEEKETYRIYVTTLMKDPKIGAYLIAKHFKNDVGLDANMASEMKGWSAEKYNPQDISNYIAGYHNLKKELLGSSESDSGGYGTIKPR